MAGLLLVLVRHAKSSWKHPVDDINRPLNKRGRRDAPRMAALLADWLTVQQAPPARLVTSPARRARDTAEAFARALATVGSKPLVDADLYHAGASGLLDTIRAQPAAPGCLILFGHNPGFTDALNRLAGAGLDNLPTCAVACLEPRGRCWKEVGWGTCELLHLDYPKRHPFGRKGATT